MTRRPTIIVFAAILVAVLGLTSGVQGQVTPAAPAAPDKFGAVGAVTAPHGFPISYSDGAAHTVALCIDQIDPFCITTPPEVVGTFAPGFGDEGFWWSADANAPPLVGGGRALLVLAVEAAYAGDGSVKNGNQMSFARLRIRVDVPSAGDYLVTHPYGTNLFRGVTVADGINFTEDIGAFDPLLVNDPIPTTPPLATTLIADRAGNNFMGAQASPILESFLIWDPAVLPLAPVGYVGDAATEHTVIGSPTGNNFFKVEKVTGTLPAPVSPAVSTQTNLFVVMGKIYSGTPAATAHTYPPASPKNLQDIGPPPPAGPLYRPVGATPGYPVGFPIFYEDNPTPLTPTPGLRLTICPAVDPMCISAPVDPADPASVALNTGDEGFFWVSDARVDVGTLPGGRDAIGLLVLGLEAAFGGAGSVRDGNQMVFGRIRIRIDTPRAGTYTVTHPYGVNTFVVTAAEQAATGGRRAINYTEDIGGFNPFQYDPTFQGQEPNQMFDRALYSKLGPQFLTWPNFTAEPSLLINGIQYIGDPGVDHEVTGSPLGQNFFRIQGPGGIDVQTNLFTVSGKVYDPDTFEVIPPATAPIANGDAASTNQNVAVNIPVLANDTLAGGATPLVGVTAVTLGNPAVTGPANGTAVLNANNTVTYTPNLNFFGTDSFTYTFTATGGTSNVATVTVTVNSIEVLAITRAQANIRGRLVATRGALWTIRGTGAAPGAIVSIHAGSNLAAPLIATVTANRRGAWTFSGRRLPGFAPPAGTTPIFVSSSGGDTVLGSATVR